MLLALGGCGHWHPKLKEAVTQAGPVQGRQGRGGRRCHAVSSTRPRAERASLLLRPSCAFRAGSPTEAPAAILWRLDQRRRGEGRGWGWRASKATWRNRVFILQKHP